MAAILPESDGVLPLGSIPATSTTASAPAPSARPPRLKRKLRPKLTIADLTTASAVESALSIGRRVASRGMPEPGHEGAALASFLGKMRRWAADVAPEYDIAEFVVGAQGLAGKREFKPILGNLRLAELRQVTGGWEELQMKKKMSRKGRKKVTEEEEEEEVEGRDEDEANGDGENGGEEAGSDKKDVQALMNDPEVKKRIERNRQLALQRRLKVAERAGPARVGGSDDMEIDPNDVVEQEDIDMDILDEMNDWGEQQNVAGDREKVVREDAKTDVAAAVTGKSTQPDTTTTDEQREEERPSAEVPSRTEEGPVAATSSDADGPEDVDMGILGEFEATKDEEY